MTVLRNIIDEAYQLFAKYTITKELQLCKPLCFDLMISQLRKKIGSLQNMIFRLMLGKEKMKKQQLECSNSINSSSKNNNRSRVRREMA